MRVTWSRHHSFCFPCRLQIASRDQKRGKRKGPRRPRSHSCCHRWQLLVSGKWRRKRSQHGCQNRSEVHCFVCSEIPSEGKGLLQLPCPRVEQRCSEDHTAGSGSLGLDRSHLVHLRMTRARHCHPYRRACHMKSGCPLTRLGSLALRQWQQWPCWRRSANRKRSLQSCGSHNHQIHTSSHLL